MLIRIFHVKAAYIFKSNWTVEGLRAARHSKLMCALVLAMRKVPIFGPAGGLAPLGDPANPSYSVTVSDEGASRSRDKAAKDADAARLHPTVNEGVAGSSGRLPSETTTAEALNTIRLSEDILKEEEGEDDDVIITRNRGFSEGMSSVRTMDMPTGANMELKKSRSPQGRRRAGVIGPSVTSIISRQSQNIEHAIETSQTRTRTDQFDQEAQISR
jgi:hypothetical protein